MSSHNDCETRSIEIRPFIYNISYARFTAILYLYITRQQRIGVIDAKEIASHPIPPLATANTKLILAHFVQKEMKKNVGRKKSPGYLSNNECSSAGGTKNGMEKKHFEKEDEKR